MKASSLTDYTKRIDHVVDALAASLAAGQPPPSNAELARVANFSEFHFMRVYRALAGESLGVTIQRLRLRRAAHLLASTQYSISDISGRVGFETPQAFARAFRQHFNVAPSEAREAELMDPPMKHAFQAKDPAIRVDIVGLQPFRVVVLRNQGAYADLDAAYGRLFAWMAQHGALDSIAGIWGIPYHDRRDDAPETSLFDCCLATAAPLEAADGVTPGTLGDGDYVRYRHMGSFARLDDAHDPVLRLVLQLPAVALRESPILHEYLNDPESTPEAELATHIYVPVTKVHEAMP